MGGFALLCVSGLMSYCADTSWTSQLWYLCKSLLTSTQDLEGRKDTVDRPLGVCSPQIQHQSFLSLLFCPDDWSPLLPLVITCSIHRDVCRMQSLMLNSLGCYAQSSVREEPEWQNRQESPGSTGQDEVSGRGWQETVYLTWLPSECSQPAVTVGLRITWLHVILFPLCLSWWE